MYFLLSEITVTEKTEKAVSFGKLQVWYNNPLTSSENKLRGKKQVEKTGGRHKVLNITLRKNRLEEFSFEETTKGLSKQKSGMKSDSKYAFE